MPAQSVTRPSRGLLPHDFTLTAPDKKARRYVSVALFAPSNDGIPGLQQMSIRERILICLARSLLAILFCTVVKRQVFGLSSRVEGEAAYTRAIIQFPESQASI